MREYAIVLVFLVCVTGWIIEGNAGAVWVANIMYAMYIVGNMPTRWHQLYFSKLWVYTGPKDDLDYAYGNQRWPDLT